jgi:3-oxoacyl-[acyl-carrier-protein] synthase-3
MNKSIGILGIGTYLPTEIRTNAWWPDHVVESWKAKAARRAEKLHAELVKENTEGARLTLAALTALASDPFQGARERRVIPDTMTCSDMETIAAREAISRAGIRKEDIGLVLSHQICPDYINVPSAAVVHGNLDLNEHCTTLAVDAACNSFMLQLTLAQGMIASGQARYALLTQSSALTRFPASGELIDAWGGDAASAIVVGPVSEGRGILSYSHHTAGKLWGALVCGVPGRRWQDDRCVIYSEDRMANLDMVVRIADRAKHAVGEALALANLTTDDVSFFGAHQGFKWLLPVTHEVTGLTKARAVDHFHYTGTISSVNIPFQMAVAEKEGLLKPGDVVACFQGGTGMTWSGMTLRWGS